MISPPPVIMAEMRALYEERSSLYNHNWLKIGRVLEALFDGKPMTFQTPNEWNKLHLLVMVLQKITRYVETDFTHQDSVRDCAVYLTMLESLLREEEFNARDRV